MGAPSDAQIGELQVRIEQIIEPFGLRLGQEITWLLPPLTFMPEQQRPAAVVFFGAPGVSPAGVDRILQDGIPVLPVTSAANRVHLELPEQLRALNCLNYAEAGPERISLGSPGVRGTATAPATGCSSVTGASPLARRRCNYSTLSPQDCSRCFSTRMELPQERTFRRCSGIASVIPTS